MDFPSAPAVKLHPTTGDFTDGDPGAGVDASIDKAAEYNQLWKELIELITHAGLVANEGDLTQVRQAVVGLIATQITALVDSSPGTLDTLNELAAALGDDPSFATTITNALALKAPLASPALTGTPTAPTQAAGNNSTRLANTAFVSAAIAALVDSSPGTLDTLNELAAALGDDPNFATTITNALALKAPLASPALTGNPTVPTQTAGNNSTRAASTAFVKGAVDSVATVVSSGSNANGYWRQWSDGFIEQGGTVSMTFNGSETSTVFNLPITMTGGIKNMSLCLDGQNVISNTINYGIKTKTTTSFTVTTYSNNGSTRNILWRATND